MKTTVKAIVAAAILLSFCLPIFSQQVAKTIPNATSPDGIIGFLEFKPRDYGSQKHPLIIFLHGIGERGNGTSQINAVANNAIPRFCANGATMRFTVNGQTSSFVVLSPQLSTQYGYWPTFYVKEMIKYAKANLQIDPNRIYITGLSLGGGGTWRAITETNTENFDYSFDAGIAAAAPVCGTQEMNDGYFSKTVGDNHLPIWAFHCMDDGTVGVGATQHGEIVAKNCGLTPAAKFTYYQSGGHAGAWINAYDTGHIATTVNGGGSFTANPNMYEWFLSNTRSTTQPSYTAPAANAGAAQTITLPASTVNLSGSGTGTGGATISSYSWTKTSGPASGNIATANAAATSVTGLVQGVYVFTLTVTDSHGMTNTANVTITVNSAANQSPVASAGNNIALTLPTNNATLNGSASKDPDGTISAYAWTKTSGPSSGSISSANAATTNITGLVQGTYVFTLTVTDNAGATNSSPVTVTVNGAAAGNQFPAANAGKNQTITLPAVLTLDASASSDPDGSIVSYRWTQTSGPIGPVMTSRDAKTTTVTGLLMGNYTFVLQVKDNSGLEASAAVAVTVNPVASIPSAPSGPQANILPNANAGPNRTITLPTALTLDASGSSDPDGYIASYRWTQTAGPVGPVMNTRDAKTTAVTGLVAGDYTFVLQIVDNAGGNASQSVNIKVNGAGTTTTGNLLGYIKMSVGPYQACADASSSGRIPVYGTSIANGAILYTDAAMKQVYNGGWNWFSFTPALGGAVTQAFAIYPTGGILLLRSCTSGARLSVTTTAEQDEASLQRMKDSATGATMVAKGARLTMYPNPVHTNTTIQLYSADSGIKTINLYNSAGVLQAKYTWQTVQGNNTYSLKDVSGLANGLYIIEIRNSTGKTAGSIKFLKM